MNKLTVSQPSQKKESSRPPEGARPTQEPSRSKQDEPPEDYEVEQDDLEELDGLDGLGALFGAYFCTDDQQSVAQVLSNISLSLEENTRAVSQLIQVQMEFAKSVHQLAKVCAEHIRKN